LKSPFVSQRELVFKDIEIKEGKKIFKKIFENLHIILQYRVLTYFVGMSLNDFSFSNVSFSSEVGTVLKAAFKLKQNQIYLIYVERSCFN